MTSMVKPISAILLFWVTEYIYFYSSLPQSQPIAGYLAHALLAKIRHSVGQQLYRVYEALGSVRTSIFLSS